MGRVFRQIKGGIPPDSAFLFPALVSIRKTRWEWHGHQRALSSASGLCLPSPATHPFVLACSSLSRPLPAGAQIPQAPVPFLYSCLPHAGAPFSLTHLPRLGSHPLSLWGQLLRHLHSTDHPDSMMPTAVSTIDCCVCVSFSLTL